PVTCRAVPSGRRGGDGDGGRAAHRRGSHGGQSLPGRGGVGTQRVRATGREPGGRAGQGAPGDELRRLDRFGGGRLLRRARRAPGDAQERRTGRAGGVRRGARPAAGDGRGQLLVRPLAQPGDLMAEVSIGIEEMADLVRDLESARDEAPGYVNAIRGRLEGVWLSTESVDPLGYGKPVWGWLDERIMDVHRRLSMARLIAQSSPGAGLTTVTFDDSVLSDLSQAQV